MWQANQPQHPGLRLNQRADRLKVDLAYLEPAHDGTTPNFDTDTENLVTPVYFAAAHKFDRNRRIFGVATGMRRLVPSSPRRSVIVLQTTEFVYVAIESLQLRIHCAYIVEFAI